MGHCLSCNGVVRRNATKYCSIQCQQDFQFAQKYAKFLEGENNIFQHHKSLRRALTVRDGYRCNCCGLSDWCGKPITLETEHKDGNSENNTSANLCLLCPNCHSQTSTYKAKNKGNGRHSRRQRYAEGKSY